MMSMRAYCFVCSQPIYEGQRSFEFFDHANMAPASKWRECHATCGDAAKAIAFLERPEHDWWIAGACN